MQTLETGSIVKHRGKAKASLKSCDLRADNLCLGIKRDIYIYMYTDGRGYKYTGKRGKQREGGKKARVRSCHDYKHVHARIQGPFSKRYIVYPLAPPSPH